MINAKCIEKFRDNQGRLIGYKLVDYCGQTQELSSEDLKRAIVNKQINVINLTLTKDRRLVDAGISTNIDSLTKKLYLTICNNQRFKILKDYKIKYRYDCTSNKLYLVSKFVPSYGTDLEQNFFNNDEKEQHIVVTDKDKEFYMYVNNELTLKTKDMLLVLNMLNVVDSKIESIKSLEDSSDLILDAFSNFCGTQAYIEITDLLRGHGATRYDRYVPLELLRVCIMEMTYESIKRKRQELSSLYNGYIFRGQTSKEFNPLDPSFKSATTSMNVALQYGKNGILLAIKNVKLCDIIDVKYASSYDKDYIYYEHEVLIRDFNKITIGNQIGTLKGIPIYAARLEMPQLNRIQCIEDKHIRRYGTKNQLNFVLYILKNLKLVYDIEITIYGDMNVYGNNDNEAYIKFDDNDNININDMEYNNIQDALKKYNSIIN